MVVPIPRPSHSPQGRDHAKKKWGDRDLRRAQAVAQHVWPVAARVEVLHRRHQAVNLTKRKKGNDEQGAKGGTICTLVARRRVVAWDAQLDSSSHLLLGTPYCCWVSALAQDIECGGLELG
eukprot:scaffold3504_cov240-Pinguiococcus_pyrenoidosus.AAC.64